MGVESYSFGCIYIISIRKMSCSVNEWVPGLGSLYSVYCVYDLLSMIKLTFHGLCNRATNS